MTFVRIAAMSGITRHEPRLRCMLQSYGASAYNKFRQIMMLKLRDKICWRDWPAAWPLKYHSTSGKNSVPLSMSWNGLGVKKQRKLTDASLHSGINWR